MLTPSSGFWHQYIAAKEVAVNRVPAGTILRLKLQVGMDEQGNPKYRNKNLRYVKTETQDQDLFPDYLLNYSYETPSR